MLFSVVFCFRNNFSTGTLLQCSVLILSMAKNQSDFKNLVKNCPIKFWRTWLIWVKHYGNYNEDKIVVGWYKLSIDSNYNRNSERILNDRTDNPLRWVHEPFYYLQQPEIWLSFLYTLYLTLEFE